jgi:hypothetical protein
MAESNNMKICCTCKEHPRVKNCSYCRECKNKWKRDRRVANPDKVKAEERAYYYKLSPDQFRAMLRVQKNACALCRVLFTPEIIPSVDHNHSCCATQKTCGKCTRGLLCNTCNTILGKIEDNAEWLKRAGLYLKRHTVTRLKIVPRGTLL